MNHSVSNSFSSYTKPIKKIERKPEKKKTKPEPSMPAINSTHHFTSMRDKVVALFKELGEILCKSSELFIALIAATTSDAGKSLFKEQQKLMMALVLFFLFYSFLVIIGTIVQHYNRTLLPIINFAMLVLGSAVLVMALRIITSPTIAWITLALCFGMLALVAYDYDVPQRIKNWIGRVLA